MTRREFYGKGFGKRKFSKDDPDTYDPGPQTKIDALVRVHTGFASLKQMCKSNPTLRAPPGANNKEKQAFAQLRKAYKRVTGKEASK
jgi:hypothetical protein